MAEPKEMKVVLPTTTARSEISPTNLDAMGGLSLVDEETQTVHKDDDGFGWLLSQISLLRTQHYGALDWTNLAEELEEMAGLQRDTVVSLLRVVLLHLLKWRYSRVRRSDRSWKVSIVAARVSVTDVLADSKTLKNELPALLAKAYRGARAIAGAEMGMDKHDWQRLFPDNCPWTEEQVLDEDFLPDLDPDANGRS